MAVLFFAYTTLESRADDAHALRFRSVRLAYELRLSSDELSSRQLDYATKANHSAEERAAQQAQALQAEQWM